MMYTYAYVKTIVLPIMWILNCVCFTKHVVNIFFDFIVTVGVNSDQKGVYKASKEGIVCVRSHCMMLYLPYLCR